MASNRPLRIFLCHASDDKPAVRKLYKRLIVLGIDAWLDERKILPGQDWKIEIPKAVRGSDAVIVCLSKKSTTKEGYVQKEILFALDVALEKPENTIYIIPAKIQECKLPDRLSHWQSVRLYEPKGFDLLLQSLQLRAKSLKLKAFSPKPVEKIKSKIRTKRDKIETPNLSETKAAPRKKPVSVVFQNPKLFARLTEKWITGNKLTLTNGMEFMYVPAGEFIMGSDRGSENEKPQHLVDIPYDFCMARFPVTNILFNDYIDAIGGKRDFPPDKKQHPMVAISILGAVVYSEWLNKKFRKQLPPRYIVRLPSEAEWEKAARGTDGRIYPWGNSFDMNKCNCDAEKAILDGDTTAVGLYSPGGDSPFGCADMAGNVWEWTLSLYKNYPYTLNNGREPEELFRTTRVLRGGSFSGNAFAEPGWDARCSVRYSYNNMNFGANDWGFRLVIAPPIKS